jgi:hypothetical protein
VVVSLHPAQGHFWGSFNSPVLNMNSQLETPACPQEEAEVSWVSSSGLIAHCVPLAAWCVYVYRCELISEKGPGSSSAVDHVTADVLSCCSALGSSFPCWGQTGLRSLGLCRLGSCPSLLHGESLARLL